MTKPLETTDQWILYQYNRGLLLWEIGVTYNMKAAKVEQVLKRMGVEQIRPQTPRLNPKKIHVERMKYEQKKTIYNWDEKRQAAVTRGKGRWSGG